MAPSARNEQRKLRHGSSRRRVQGTPERPRLNVFRSAVHIYAQVIDDTAGHTLVAASTLGSKAGGNLEGAKSVGAAIAEKAKAAGISAVVFDRGGMKYHGRVRAVADAAREAGLEF